MAAGLAVGLYLAHLFYAPRLELAETRVAALASALDEQNKAVAALQEADRRRAAHAKAAIAAADAGRAEAEAQASDLLGRQLPSGSDQCAEASALIRKEFGK